LVIGGVIAVCAVLLAVGVAAVVAQDGGEPAAVRLQASTDGTTTSSLAPPSTTGTTTAPESAPAGPTSTTRAIAPTTSTTRPAVAPSSTTTTTSPPPPLPDLDPEPAVCEAPGAIAPAVAGEEVLGILRNNVVYEVSPTGGHEYPLPGATNVDGAAWTADGGHVALVQFDPQRRTATGGLVKNLVVHDVLGRCRTRLSPQTVDAYDTPDWSIDGQRLRFRYGAGDGSRSRAAEVAPTGGPVRDLGPGGQLAWSPDHSGAYAVAVAKGIEIHRPGAAVVAVEANGGAEFPQWSPDGKRLLFFRSIVAGLWVMDADGSGLHDALPPGTPSGGFTASWSPDSAHLAFVRLCCQDGKGGFESDLWIVDPDGTHGRAITTGHRVYLATPIWSPAGDRIAFGDATDGVSAATIRVVAVTGGEPQTVGAGLVPLAWFRRR
jgi:hypothetical protein